MTSTTPSERSQIARLASLESWAKTPNRTARTARGRAASLDRFEKIVDPEGALDSVERANRADAARRAHFVRMGLKSAQSRRRAAEARRTAIALDREADAADAELAGLDAVGGDVA